MPPRWRPRVNEGVTAALDARAAATKERPAPVITGVRDLQMDAPEGRVYESRAGVALKSVYLARAKTLGITTQGEPAAQKAIQRLEEYLVKCKAVGQFASLFGADSAQLPVVESSELIEFLRPASILLNRPGLRKVSGYGGKFVIGKLNEVPVAYWVAEGQPSDKSKLDAGLLELGSHKLMGLARISNGLLRRGDSEASANVGAELQKSAALLARVAAAATLAPFHSPGALVRSCQGTPSYSERPRQDPRGPSSNGGPHAFPSLPCCTSALGLSLREHARPAVNATAPCLRVGSHLGPAHPARFRADGADTRTVVDWKAGPGQGQGTAISGTPRHRAASVGTVGPQAHRSGTGLRALLARRESEWASRRGGEGGGGRHAGGTCKDAGW
ncbi:MAG TPA: hypothetical protein VEY88_02675, partial [Archangium sp.]|nr:hypothetical protein [Archangium sp.]